MRTHACIPIFMNERKRLCMFSTTVLGLQRHLAARPSRLMQVILRSTSLLPNCYLPDHIVYMLRPMQHAGSVMPLFITSRLWIWWLSLHYFFPCACMDITREPSMLRICQTKSCQGKSADKCQDFLVAHIWHGNEVTSISSLVLVSINLMILGWIWSARVWVHFGRCISYILGTLDSALTNSMEGTKPIESLISI